MVCQTMRAIRGRADNMLARSPGSSAHDITVCELAAGIEAGVQQRPDQLVFALVVGGQPGAVPAGDLSGARWGS
jgi:hypothetical protein